MPLFCLGLIFIEKGSGGRLNYALYMNKRIKTKNVLFLLTLFIKFNFIYDNNNVLSIK
jgi:hypothetical protein